MIGLPGAGKDTWIRKHHPNCNYVVSRDDIRIELGMCGPNGKARGTNSQENVVTGLFNLRLQNYAEKALSELNKLEKLDHAGKTDEPKKVPEIIINNTNSLGNGDKSRFICLAGQFKCGGNNR